MRKKKQNKHIFKVLTLLSLSICQIAYGAETDIGPTAQKNIDVNYSVSDLSRTKDTLTTDSKIYTTPVEISLYQLALQSGITVDALRKLNNGTIDGLENLPAMQSILLPKSSSLFANVKEDEASAISTLPELGSKGTTDATTAQALLNNSPADSYVTGTTEQNVANLAQTAATQNWDELTTEKIRNDAEQWAKNQAKQAVMAPIQQSANELLGKFGKGSINISIDEDGSLKGSTLSLLSPLYDNNESLIFSQLGVHRQNSERTVGNFGLGYRYEQDSYLLGSNVFIDHDFSGSNTRLGLGTELWMDYVKLAANYYMPLSDWKDSSVILDFEERPAKGFDIRAQGYLPAYPQLGASLKYEQYFGDQVGLFGDNEDSLQRDPKAFSIGVDYTPIPLLTFGAEQRFGDNGKKDTRFDMNLNVQFGTPLEKQLDPANVAGMRSLKGSRYDLVDRNYDIVFEYRQKAFQITWNLPTPYTIQMGETLPLQILTTSQSPIRTVVWSVKTKFGADVTSQINPQDLTDNDLKLNFKPTELETYIFIATVTNEAGITVTSTPFILNVRLKDGEKNGAEIVFVNAEIGANSVSPLPSFSAGDYTDNQKLNMTVQAVQYDANGHNPQPIIIPNATWWIQVSQGNTIYINTLDPDKQSGSLDNIALVISDPLADPVNGMEYGLVSAIDFGREPVTVKIGYGVVNGESIAPVERQVYFHNFNAGNLALQLVERGVSGTASPLLMNDTINLKTDTYYEAVIVDTLIGKDVTAEFADGIRWHYYDGADTIDMEACQGYTMFSTQRTNFDNNEFSWGQLVKNQYDTEQSLRLRPSIDPSNWNPNGVLNSSRGAERGLIGTEYNGNVFCPDGGASVAADNSYDGFEYVILNGQG